MSVFGDIHDIKENVAKLAHFLDPADAKRLVDAIVSIASDVKRLTDTILAEQATGITVKPNPPTDQEP